MENKANTPDPEGTNCPNYSFAQSISSYIKHIDALFEISPFIMELVIGKITQESRLIGNFIKSIQLDNLNIQDDDEIQDAEIVEDNSEEKESTKDSASEKEATNSKKISIPLDDINKFIDLSDKVEASTLAYKYIPISIIISLVSQYDAYLNGLIRTIFHVKPEILNSSERNIQFTELLAFKTISEAKEFIIEQEIESIMRENHIKQLKWLENKLKIKLREGVPNLTQFVELTERRNLFVHCNGVVTRQYLEVCRENNVAEIDHLKPGDILDVKPDYLHKAYYALFEIGIKLGHVIWRKLQPEMIKEADDNLNEICYDLINCGRYNLAITLLTFATETLKKHSDQEIVCILNINKSLAYYLKGDNEIALDMLKQMDWTATSEKFQLALAVLNENYPKASEIMLSIGSNNPIVNKNAYREWPLFSVFRKTEIFQQTYRKVFGEDFVYKEAIPSQLEDILEEIRENKEKARMRRSSNYEPGV